MTSPSVFRAEKVIVILVVIGYVSMTILSIIKWNEATSGALITGFALFAQHTVQDFFRLIRGTYNGEPEPPVEEPPKTP